MLTNGTSSPRDLRAWDAPKRIVLYSHDTCGLGHIRRNLLIATTLRKRLAEVDILVISGTGRAWSYPIASGIDVVTLPALRKQRDGSYRSRRLGVKVRSLVKLRSDLLHAAVSGFDPHLFIVDNVPLGAMSELRETLSALRAKGSCHTVLGLRDVLDSSQAVAAEWGRARNIEAIRRFYDQVWIYADPSVFDATLAYGFPPDITDRVVFTGYFDHRKWALSASTNTVESPKAPDWLCAVGGGQDGFRLAQAFAQSTVPEHKSAGILAGPFMGSDRLHQLQKVCDSRANMKILPFTPDPMPLYRKADRVVCMGGYNTVFELLSLGKRPLIVPRVRPRREQLIRAKALHGMGLVDVFHPSDARPEAISEWLRQPVEATDAKAVIEMKGLERITQLATVMLGENPLHPTEPATLPCTN